MAHDVFVSYSNHDKSVGDAVCAVLEHDGIRCWMAPRDVTPGTDWSAEIIDAIHASRLMVLVYSANANTSPQIKREVERAVAIGIPILPSRIEDVPMSKSLEYFISAPHWLDALTPPLERHLDYLARTVQLLLSRLGPAPIPGPVQPPDGSAASENTGSNSASARNAGSPRAASLSPRRTVLAGRVRPMAAGAAVVVLVLGGFGVRQWMNGGSRVADAPDGRHTDPTAAAVDQAIAGPWAFTTLNQAGTWNSTLKIDRLGAYQMRAVVHDSGQVTVGPGWFRMVSTTQNVITGTVRPIDATTVEITSQTGVVRWSRVPGSPMPQGPSGWAGVWQATPSINGVPWRQTIENRVDSTYTLTSVVEDSGWLTASGGQYHLMSSSGLVTDGTYQVTGGGSLSFTGPLGLSVWTRER